MEANHAFEEEAKMKPFYVEQMGYHFYVIDYLTKQEICRVCTMDLESGERWANRIAKALNEMMPIQS